MCRPQSSCFVNFGRSVGWYEKNCHNYDLMIEHNVNAYRMKVEWHAHKYRGHHVGRGGFQGRGGGGGVG